MKKFWVVMAVLVAVASFAVAPALAKDLSGYYSVKKETEKWTQEVCKYGDCEPFYTGHRDVVISIEPIYLAHAEVEKLQAEGKLVESAPSRAKTKPEKIQRANSAVKKTKAAKSAPKRARIAKKSTELKRPKLVPAIPIPSDSECVTHKVARGETVIGLAKKLGTTPEMIWALNHDLIKNPNLIKIGWNLKVPASKLAPTDSAPVSTSSGAATAPASAHAPVITGTAMLI